MTASLVVAVVMLVGKLVAYALTGSAAIFAYEAIADLIAVPELLNLGAGLLITGGLGLVNLVLGVGLMGGSCAMPTPV